jgi:hypothetical protein
MERERPSTTFLVGCLLLVLALGVGSYFWATAPVDEDRVLMRYVRPVTNSVNPHELQQWAVSVLQNRKPAQTITNATSLTVQEVPPVVRAIPTLGFAGPQVLLPSIEASKREPHVAIAFLGGFGSWGIWVGGETFRLPEGPRCYEWIPGVYITIHP